MKRLKEGHRGNVEAAWHYREASRRAVEDGDREIISFWAKGVHTARAECRTWHLAACLVRGTPYRQCERYTRSRPDWAKIRETVLAHSPDTTIAQINEWTRDGLNHWYRAEQRASRALPKPLRSRASAPGFVVGGEGLAVRARRAKALEQLEAAQTEARQEVGVSRR